MSSSTPPDGPTVLSTTAGEIDLHAYHLRVEDRAFSILHTGALLSHEEERGFLEDQRLPYGVKLWPGAIALAHEVAARPFAGKHVLELGAGTGLPGIVAAARGARVVQTDRQPLALHVCKLNAERNHLATIELRFADWTAWDDTTAYDVILGSDILYAESLHPQLRQILEGGLAPGGTILLSDPFRKPGLDFLEAMEADGWRVTMNKWTVAAAGPARPVGVFEVTRG